MSEILTPGEKQEIRRPPIDWSSDDRREGYVYEKTVYLLEALDELGLDKDAITSIGIHGSVPFARVLRGSGDEDKEVTGLIYENTSTGNFWAEGWDPSEIGLEGEPDGMGNYTIYF